MLALDHIHEFISQTRIAVVGVSRAEDIPANHIFRKFKKAGYDVTPVNTQAEKVEGVFCYPDLESCPEKPEAVVLASTPGVSLKYVEECIKLNIPLVWMHKGIGKGSFSKRAAKKLMENGVKVIANGCPLMFIQPVDPFHKILCWFKG